MGLGKIRNFRKGGEPEPQTRILSQAIPAPPRDEPTPTAEVVVHEEVIREGDGKARVREGDGIEIRVRQPKDIEKWENVKRGNDW